MRKSSVTSVFLWTRLLTSPLDAVFTLLIFIIGMELQATVLQLTVLAAIKPAVSLLAFHIHGKYFDKCQNSRNYLILLNLAGCLPVLLFPYVLDTWFYIICYALFQTAQRAAFPAWGEILKSHAGTESLGKIFSKSTSINYVIIIFIPLLFSYQMDTTPWIWKYIFPVLAVIQVANTFLLLLLPKNKNFNAHSNKHTMSNAYFPCLEDFKLLKEEPEFKNYLLLFFLGGIGLVAIQPIIPVFFHETLRLSYLELTAAFSLCKGVAFIFSSPLWSHFINKVSLFRLNGYINLLSALFIVFLLCSGIYTGLLFPAFLIYGIMQAGCDLSWNISGPLFSKKKNSAGHSRLNLAFVGLRGCICPFIGKFIFLTSNATGVFLFAGILCLFSSFYAYALDRKYCINKEIAL